MIKNFVVKVKQINFEEKGLRNFLNYLEDEKRHPNGIMKIKNFSKKSFFKQTILNITEYNINKKSGRKSKNYADSFIFTIPPQYQEKGKEKLKEILNNLVGDIYKQFNEQLEEKIKKEDFLKQIYINIHIDKKHIHFNVVFPRIIKIGEKLISNRITNRKKFLHRIKQYWTHNLTKNLDISIEDYKPETKFRKGYKNKYFKDLINKNNETLEKIKEKEEEIKQLDELLTMKRNEIKNYLERISEENEREEKVVAALGLIIRYYRNFIKGIQKNEKRKILKNYQNLKNKIKEIERYEIKNKGIKGIVEEIKDKSTKYGYSLGI